MARFAVVLMASIGVIAFAEPALATTYCVPDTTIQGCPSGSFTPLGTDAGTKIQNAMSIDGADGVPDTVYVGAGTYADPYGDAFAPHGTDDLTIVGAGRDSTILTSISTGNKMVMNLGAVTEPRHVSMRNLAVVIPESFPNGPGWGAAIGGTRDAVFSSIDVINENEPLGSGEIGSAAIPNIMEGSSFSDVRLFGRHGARFSTGFGSLNCGAGQVTIKDSEIAGANRAIDAKCDDMPFKVSNTSFFENDWTINAESGARLTASNILIEGGDFVPVDVYNHSGDGPTVVNLDHMTLISGDTAEPAIRVGVSTTLAPATESAVVNVTNSIIAYADKAYSLSAPTDPAKGDAVLNVDHSDVTAGGVGAGDSSYTATATINQDPGFAGAADYHLTASSPVIDAGDPDAADPIIDLDGNDRPLDGNCDGIPVRDMGAYEFVPPPNLCPTPTCETDPTLCPDPPPDKTAPKVTKLRVKYRVGKGGKLSFKISEKATVIAVFKPTPRKLRGKKRKTFRITRRAKPGANTFKLARNALKAGRYSLTVRAADKAGNKSKSLTRKIRVR